MRTGRTLALAAAPLLAAPLVGAPAALAQSSGTRTYTANLAPVPLNGANGGGGTLTLTLNGTTAQITEDVHGLASTFMGKPYPHVQHIHGLAMGTCPSASADANHDGVISTPEAQPDYGAIQTTLSTSGDTSPAAGTNTSIAPSGSSFHYSRTIQLDSSTMQAINANNAVIVVHGLDPATAAKAATTTKSSLVPSLPLAATAPALCGKLVAASAATPSNGTSSTGSTGSTGSSQVSNVPNGAPQTGGGSTAGFQDMWLLALGAAALVTGTGTAGTLAYRRRLASTR